MPFLAHVVLSRKIVLRVLYKCALRWSYCNFRSFRSATLLLMPSSLVPNSATEAKVSISIPPQNTTNFAHSGRDAVIGTTLQAWQLSFFQCPTKLSPGDHVLTPGDHVLTQTIIEAPRADPYRGYVADKLSHFKLFSNGPPCHTPNYLFCRMFPP